MVAYRETVRMKTLFLFDFDGVLIDSAAEIVLSSHNAVTGLFCTAYDDVPESYRNLFLASKGSSRSAGEMIVLGQAVLDRIGEGELERPITRSELEVDISLAEADLNDFKELFFATREKLVTHAPEAWAALHHPIEPLWSLIQRMQGSKDVFLLTHKNSISVKRLIDHYRLPIAPENIYSSDTGKAKHENFLDLASTHPASCYVVVDDAPNNLIEIADHTPQDVQTRLIHANWGYGKLAELKEFHSRGIESLELDEFLSHDLCHNHLRKIELSP